MQRAWSSLVGVLALVVVQSGWHSASAQGALEYQKRAQRYEGIRPKPVSGYDLELVSARVDYMENASQVGERLAVKFFLERIADTYLTVRELDYKYYYWLDRVTPASPWQAGFGNVFEWSTADVVRQIPGLRLSDLGVVVRLGKAQPSSVETVAPVIFYQSNPPEHVTGYVFSFRLRDDASITSTIFREGADAPMEVKRFARQSGGTVVSVKWDASSPSIGAGRYRLVLRGYVLDTNAPIAQTVQFYHQPVVR